MKIWYFLFFLLINFSLCKVVFANQLTVPTPTLPKAQLPWKTNDVFSINLIGQIHKQLFKLDSFGSPVPDLLKDFNYDSQKLFFSFELKDMIFHNGVKLTSWHVKKSLEAAISEKMAGNSDLSCIVGYLDYLNGINGDIKGIKVKNFNFFAIKLNCPILSLPKLLTDLRFSIIESFNNPQVGLGPYKVIPSFKNQFLIESRNGNAFFKKVVFDLKKINDFKQTSNEKYQAHIFYPESSEIKDRTLRQYNLKKLPSRSLKNYILGINPRKLNLLDRRAIAKKINRQSIINNCFPDQALNNNLVPTGFPGYIPVKFNINYSEKRNRNTPQNIRVLIARGVGREECLKKVIQDNLMKGNNRTVVEIEIVETNDVFNAWKMNKVDIIFLYLEAELALDMLQFYLPNKGLHFGASDLNKKQLAILENYNKSSDLRSKTKYYQDLHREILVQATAVPLFLKKDYLILSKSLTTKGPGLHGPTFTRFIDLHEMTK